jgi:hypothetical protein
LTLYGEDRRLLQILVTIDGSDSQGQVVYQLRPAQTLEFGGSLASAGVSFILPEIRKLVQDGKNGDVLFVMGGMKPAQPV